MPLAMDIIHTWREEVTSSWSYCGCTRPTISSGPVGGASNTGAISASASSTAVGSANRPESSRQTSPSHQPPNPLEDPIKSSSASSRHDIFRDPPLSSRSIASNLKPREDRLICSRCGLRIDRDVSLRQPKGHNEEGLICRRLSPPSTADIERIPELGEPHIGPWARYPQKAFKKLKRQSTRGESKGKRILKPLLRLLKGKKETLSSTGDGSDNGPLRTEMYRAYRLDANVDAGSVETLAALSDDEYRRPRLTIDESTARLRRAQKLLNNI